MSGNTRVARWRVVNTLPLGLWTDFVEAHPHSTIYHTPEMQDVFARVPGYRPILRAAVDDRGRPVALLTAATISLSGGIARPFTTRVVAYGGFLAEEGPRGNDALAAVLQAHSNAASTALFTELRHMHDPSQWQATLAQAGYTWAPHLNFLIPLEGGEEALWQRLNRTARKNVRRGQKAGISVVEVTGTRDLTACYDLIREVYSDVRVPLAPQALFEAAHAVLLPAGRVRFWLAMHEGQAVGARVVLLHKDTILDWYAGARREHRSLRPNDFLVWHTLTWGSSNGYRIFDFGGAGHPDIPYGVRDFKAKFGGDLVNFGRSTCVHHPMRLRFSQWAYALWRGRRRK